MRDSADETGYSNGRGAQPSQDRGPLDLPLDDEELSRLIVQRTAFPGLMIATGVLWILAGAAYVALFGLLRLFQVEFQSYDVWLLVGAFFFIKDGVQLIRGTFRDPQADGIISVLLGLFFFWQAFNHFNEPGGIGAIVFGVFFGSIFMAPGILVLLGRKQYVAWKAEQGGD